MDHYNKHFIAIIGGSVAGSEAAFILADKGFRVVVFDQKNLSYGKIEDGLPSWHVGLRNKEEANIDKRLNHENIRFVPQFKLGRDANLDVLINDWGFSAVIVAIGAWHDRRIPIEGISGLKNKGIVYQNDLLMWFNHKHEADYNGPVYDIPDGTGVVGGGLASLDVIKIVMIELVQKALKEKRNIEVDMFTLEKKGVRKTLAEHQTSLKELGLKGASLFYRRNAEDMPLKPTKTNEEEDLLRAKRVSKKLLETYRDKFLFQFEPLSVPKSVIKEDGFLRGMVFQKVKSENGKLMELAGELNTFKTDLIISSIGSLPEETPSIPHQGHLLKTYGEFGCRVEGFDNVFAIGNVVTGRGNILESKKHGREITGKIIDDHFQPDDENVDHILTEKYHDWFRSIEGEVDMKLDNIICVLEDKPTPADDKVNKILELTQSHQRKVGYDGDYLSWAKNHKPVRLEDLI